MCKSKLREGHMLMFNNEPGTFLTEGSGGAVRKSANFLKRVVLITLFCALGFMLSAPSLVQAEDLQQGTPAEQPSANVQPASAADPAGLKTSAVTENKPDAKANTQAGDGLEISPEIIGQNVGAAAKPKVNNLFVGDTTVSGTLTMGARQRKARQLDFTIHVIVNRKAGGTEEKTVTILHTNSKQTWSVSLDSALAKGNTVTVTQEYDGQTSDPVIIEANPSLKDQHEDDLKMPTGEIWIEQAGAANIVNAEEQAEALRLVKETNPDIAGDISSVELKIYGDSHPKTAKINVTYTDGTTSGEIEAPDLEIKQVTDTSMGANISDITVVDNVIKGKLNGTAPFENIKVQIYTKLPPGALNTFNSANGCKTDKNSSDPVEVNVDSATGEFTYPIPSADGLPLDRIVGVSVKEKNKFVSCGTSTVKLANPKKTEVRDPKKLTDDDKSAIDKAIRDANTVNGKSKLPDGTGFIDDPAFIEFDKDGNVTIISPNDVEVEWDSNYEPVYQKNPDGTYKLQSGKEDNVIKIPAKDLVKNIAPRSPAIAVDTDKGEVTITPPPYEKTGEDTDLASYTITYKDASDAEKTVTLTRTVDEASGKTTWTSDNAKVDENTGVIALSVEDIKVGGTITATAKDNGGLEGDTDKLDSDPVSKKLETATVSYDANKGTGKMDGKKLNKGSKYKILDNKFKAPENREFDYWEIDGNKVAAGTEITVKDNTVVKAIWKKIPVTVTYDGNGGQGAMEESKTLYKGDTYKVLASTFTAPENQEFDTWEIDGKKVAADTEITLTKDTVVKALWKDKPVPPSTTPGKDKPGNQAKPQPKPQNQNPAAGGNLSKTGANGMYSLYSSMIMLAAGSLFVISRRRRAQR